MRPARQGISMEYWACDDRTKGLPLETAATAAI